MTKSVFISALQTLLLGGAMLAGLSACVDQPETNKNARSVLSENTVAVAPVIAPQRICHSHAG